ncbi:MAG: hypothetical protein GY814_04190 [Gammaproteobacteria bacterium]|nr:hypothetical protein [Gammaproteobacteria bacterium]
MNQSQHFVKRQVFELVINSSEQSHVLQQRIIDLSNGSLQPKINALFNKCSREDEILRLQKVEIDLGVLSANDSFELQVEQKLIEQLEEEVLRLQANTDLSASTSRSVLTANESDENIVNPQQRDNAKYTTGDSQLDILCHYLETGELPWWISDKGWRVEQQIQDLLKSKPEETLSSLRRSSSELSIKRLVMQVDLATRLNLVDVLQPENKIFVRLFVDQWFDLINQLAGFTGSGLTSTARTELTNLQLVISKQQNYTELFWFELISLLLSNSAQFEAQNINQYFIKNLSGITTVRYTDIVSLFVETIHTQNREVNELGQWLQLEMHNVSSADNLSSQEMGQAETQERKLFNHSTKRDAENLFNESQFKIEKQSANEVISENAASVSSKRKESTDGHDPITETQQHLPDSDTGLNADARYLNNAGMVLSWPFLKQFFSELNLLDDNSKFCDLAARQTAVLLLQYVASGELEFLEHQLVLNKILCGWPLQQPITTTLDLQPQQQLAVDELLLSLITHWSALKSTSIEGLRSAFIMREGRLKSQQNGWLLQIERNGYDVLLDSLPWGLALIKLPWMKKVIHTEW